MSVKEIRNKQNQVSLPDAGDCVGVGPWGSLVLCPVGPGQWVRGPAHSPCGTGRGCVPQGFAPVAVHQPRTGVPISPGSHLCFKSTPTSDPRLESGQWQVFRVWVSVSQAGPLGL